MRHPHERVGQGEEAWEPGHQGSQHGREAVTRGVLGGSFAAAMSTCEGCQRVSPKPEASGPWCVSLH